MLGSTFNMGSRLDIDIADGQREGGELDQEASEVLLAWGASVVEHRVRREVGRLRGTS